MGAAAKDGPGTQLAAASSAGADAGSGIGHTSADRLTQRQSGNGNDRTDDREDQRIFGRGRAGLVLQHVDERLHGRFLPLKSTRADTTARADASRVREASHELENPEFSAHGT